MNVALIGTGYWGKIYKKTLENFSDVNVYTCTHNYNQIIKDKSISAVIIATPADTHFNIAKKCLLSGKHILLEKPVTSNVNDAYRLLELNEKYNDLIILPGHVYLHHDGIIKLKNIIKTNHLGKISSIYSKRLSTNNKYPNSLWEAGIHDLYILRYFFENYYGENKNAMGDVNHCFFNIEYDSPNKLNVYIEVNNNYHKKVREIIVDGNKKQAIFDDEHLVIRDKETNEQKEIELDLSITPLEKQCKYFFDCIITDSAPKISYFDAVQDIITLENIEESLNNISKTFFK